MRELTVRELTVRELTVRELTVRELTVRELTVRELTVRELTVRELTVRELTVRELTVRELTVRELTVREKRATGLYRRAVKGSPSQKIPPLPPTPFRSIKVDVEIIEILKSGKRKLPSKLSIRMIRAFLSEQYMKEDIAEMKSNLINHKQIYLDFSNNSFRTENPNEILKIKGLLSNKRGIRAKRRAGQTLGPKEQAPILLNHNNATKQRFLGIA